MTVRQFRALFADLAASRQWTRIPGGWMTHRQQGDECTLTLDLQPSSFGKKVYINIKIHVDNAFGRSHENNQLLCLPRLV